MALHSRHRSPRLTGCRGERPALPGAAAGARRCCGRNRRCRQQCAACCGGAEGAGGCWPGAGWVMFGRRRPRQWHTRRQLCGCGGWQASALLRNMKLEGSNGPTQPPVLAAPRQAGVLYTSVVSLIYEVAPQVGASMPAGVSRHALGINAMSAWHGRARRAAAAQHHELLKIVCFHLICCSW